jgi:hypothetical protein
VDWSDFFAPLKIRDHWPDSVHPIRYLWRAYSEKKSYGDGNPHLVVKGTKSSTSKQIDPAVSRITTDRRKLPSAALTLQTNSYWGSVAQWLPYQWPLNPNAAYIVGVKVLVRRIDEEGSSWEPSFGYLNALFQKNRPWQEPGHLLLCLGLIGRDADAKGLAIDGIVEGIESGQFDPKLFAAILVKLSEGEWIKLNRLGDNLMQVVQTSPLHAWVISESIQLWLSKTNLKQRNLFRMLEVLLEALSTLGYALNDEARTALKALKGSSKAVKLATKLLKLERKQSFGLDAIKTLAVSSRLQTA